MPALFTGEIVTNVLASAFGFVAFTYGKRMHCWAPMLCGLGMMLLPLFAEDVALLIGSLLLAGASIVLRRV